jgi:hypothetical protein
MHEEERSPFTQCDLLKKDKFELHMNLRVKCNYFKVLKKEKYL